MHQNSGRPSGCVQACKLRGPCAPVGHPRPGGRPQTRAPAPARPRRPRPRARPLPPPVPGSPAHRRHLLPHVQSRRPWRFSVCEARQTRIVCNMHASWEIALVSSRMAGVRAHVLMPAQYQPRKTTTPERGEYGGRSALRARAALAGACRKHGSWRTAGKPAASTDGHTAAASRHSASWNSR